MCHPLLFSAFLLTFCDIAVSLDVEFLRRTWDEVIAMNATCKKYDFCQMGIRRGEPLTYYSCHCDIHCVQLGTCCLDSFYVAVPQPELKAACRLVYPNKHYFMIDHCPSNDNMWDSLCQNDLDHDDGIMKIVPVTSLATSITYKNYFCFRCHEVTEEFFYWEVEATHVYSPDHSNMTDLEKSAILENQSLLKYDSSNETWVIPDKETGELKPVFLKIMKPTDIWRLTKPCIQNVISDCARDWTDEDVRKQCNTYMAIKYVQRNGTYFAYKNAHCALCNFEKIEDVYCKFPSSVAMRSKVPFSFHFLLDINRSSGEKVGKVQVCDDESVWDPYANKCRKLTCALPGRKVQNGKCVPI